MNASQRQLLGLTESHLVELVPGHKLRPAARDAFARLQRRAAEAGFNLQPVSSFRSFERQRQIWCAKYHGRRTVTDDAGRPLAVESLPPGDRIEAILRWSALPGTSRHHWGTDLDVYDPACLPEGYRLQLIPAEYQPGGPLAELADWLRNNLQQEAFFLPYARDKGGVAQEPWHISYRPQAELLLQELTADLLRQAYAHFPLPDQAEIDARLDTILTRYVFNTCR